MARPKKKNPRLCTHCMERLLGVLEDLAITAGPGPRPCGDTACAVETALGPFSVRTVPRSKVLALPPGTLFRIHVQVDADNCCQDHVLFATRGGSEKATCVVQSYINVHSTTCTTMPGTEWLTAVMDLPKWKHDATAFCSQWVHLFRVPAAHFEAPIHEVTVHVVSVSPFGLARR
jgi:hypothetical protein